MALFTPSQSPAVIVKEVGAGISVQVAKELFDCGVMAVDVAGFGGTNCFFHDFWSHGPQCRCICSKI